MVDKTIPDESGIILFPMSCGINLPQSMCCGFFVTFINSLKDYFEVKTQWHQSFVGCLSIVIQIRKWRLLARDVIVMPRCLFVLQNNAYRPPRLQSHSIYCQTSNIRCTCRRCSNYIFVLNLTPGFNGLAKSNCKTRRQSLKFWDLVRLILETLRYKYINRIVQVWIDDILVPCTLCCINLYAYKSQFNITDKWVT